MKVANHHTIDFSHKINLFQIGTSVSELTYLEKKYPQLIKVNPLNDIDFVSKNPTEGHSLFLYEVNVVESKIYGNKEFVFNYNKNTINTMTSNPFVKI